MNITHLDTESIHTNKEIDVRHSILDFHYEVSIQNVKTENNDMIDHRSFDVYDTSNYAMDTSTLCKDVPIQDIKVEPDEGGGQISPDTENSTNYDMVFKSEPKHVLLDIKNENSEVISQDIVHLEGAINNDIVHIPVLSGDDLLNGIITRKYNKMQQDFRGEINAGVEHSDVIVGNKVYIGIVKVATYKTCAVPMCGSTTIKYPNKLFIHVPKCTKRRKQWLQLARRDPMLTSVKSTIFFCEDHFDLPNDMENYIQYKVMGSLGKIRMKPDCLPSKFGCQPDRVKRTAPPQPRSAVNKRRRLAIIQEIDIRKQGS